MKKSFLILLGLLMSALCVVIVGGSATQATNEILIPERPVYARGLEFNGVDTYVELFYPFADVPNSFEFWVKVPQDVPDTTRVGVLLGSWAGRAVDNNAVGVEMHTDGRLRIHWDKGNPNRYAPGFDARTGEWIHFSIVRDPTGETTGYLGFRMYINGEIVDSFPNPGRSVNPKDPSGIGSDNRKLGGPIFHGRIGEVRVWHTSRTQEQIQQYMKAELSGQEDGLLSYWKFNDEDTGMGLVFDSSPHGNHGLIHNATWYDETRD